MRALLLLLLPFGAFAQDTCGTWQPVITTQEWTDSDPIWVYDQWRITEVAPLPVQPVGSLPSWYRPCGCPSATVETQSRINRETGEVETITRQTSYLYIRKEKTEFEKTLEMFEQ